MYNHFQTKIAELETRLNQNRRLTTQTHPQLTPRKNPKHNTKKQTKNQVHNPNTKDTD